MFTNVLEFLLVLFVFFFLCVFVLSCIVLVFALIFLKDEEKWESEL